MGDANIGRIVGTQHAGTSQWPEGVSIRPERVGDHRLIAELLTTAFESPAVARLVDAVRASVSFVPSLSFVAECGGVIVGHVMISHAEICGVTGVHRVANLSPLAVDVLYRRRGIGSALVQEAVSRADALREPCVVLEGSPKFYGRLGFEHSTRYGIEIKLPEWAPPQAAQVRILSNYEPSIRGRVVYPPAFSEVGEH